MKMTCDEIADLCRKLALLLHGGIGAADGVFLLAEEEQGQTGALLKEMGAQMDHGATLAGAMESLGVFPACVTGMVQAGEQTGHLEEMLESIARFYEQRSRSLRQIKNAVTYPSVILALMLLVLGVLLTNVLPVFDDVYATLGSRLTGVAALLLQLGQILKQSLPVLFGLLAALVLGLLFYGFCAPFKNRVNRGWTAKFGDRGVLRGYNNANFVRALAMGLESGLRVEDAAELAGKLLADVPAAAARCDRCMQLLRSETPMQEAMEKTGFLTPAQSRMLAVGLRQGSGDRVCEELANRLMEQADEALENKVAKIEPAMVLLASVLVGMILLSVMLPLMNIMSAIG